MEATSSVLWDHFKTIPQEKLQSHIILRFNSYDTDHSGSLDRTEMREAMAEMGRRPSETELDDLMRIADKVSFYPYLPVVWADAPLLCCDVVRSRRLSR